MRHSANVGDALRVLLYLHLHDRGASPLLLTPSRSCSILGYSVSRHGLPAIDQIYDATTAIALKCLRALCGPLFTSLCVQFSYSRPKADALYRQSFKSRVEFDADLSRVIFESSWLSRPIEGADADHRRQLLEQTILKADAEGPISLGERMENALHQLVLSCAASAETGP